MAHEHFNGTCEQSARNYHGAIARNFGGGKLGARLSCKAATPYNGAVSGCLIPLDYDEDPEIELERSIKICPGYKNYQDVKAYSREDRVYAETRPTIGLPPSRKSGVSKHQLHDAIGAWERKPGNKVAFAVIDAYIQENSWRIRKRVMDLYRKGKADPVLLLYKTGLIMRCDSKVKCVKVKVWRSKD